MSISQELTALNTNLTAAKNAVTTKGGTVGDTGLAGLAAEIATIPAGGTETSSEAKLTAYDSTTGVLTGTGLGTTGIVYLLDRDTHTYIAQPTSAWSATSITLTTPIDLSTLEGTTSIVAADTDGKFSTKLLLTGDVTVIGWAKLYIQNPDTRAVRTITIDNSTDFGKLYTGNSSDSAAITINDDKFYQDEVVGMQFGSDFSGTSLSGWQFLAYMANLNQPIVLPNTVTSIGAYFLRNCYSFNQPLDISSVTSIGGSFLFACYSFNQPLDTSSVTSISNNFLYNCYSFNQPLDTSSVTSISGGFLYNCYSFNQPLEIPSTITSISSDFLYNCCSFNQPLEIPSTITSISSNFLYNCYSFNQPLEISSVTSIGSNFLYNCYSFNQPLDISSVTSINYGFLYNCYSFNQPLDISSITSIGSSFLFYCYSFNQPLDISSVTSISDNFLYYCYSFNQPLDISSVTSIGGSFLNNCRSFNQPLEIPSTVTSIGNGFLYECQGFSNLAVETTTSPTDNNSLATGRSAAKMYVKGVTITGAGASTWITNLPNRTSSPYRKLIQG